MVYKIVNVQKETFDKIAKLSKFYGVPRHQLLATYIQFFEENKNVVNADFFQKSDEKITNEMLLDLMNPVTKKITKDINRIIGFLKVQDKNIERGFKELKREIIFKLGDNDELEYHPFFLEYDYILEIFKRILKEKGIDDNEKILQEIKRIYGEDEIKIFKESYDKITSKKMIQE